MSLIDQAGEQHARLAVLKATEAELTDGTDAALRVLGPPTDPIRMRGALGILLRADRHQVAADLIRDQRVDDAWIDLAALAFAFLGDIPRARSLVERADTSPDLPVMRSARLGFAEGVIDQWRKRHPKDSLLAIQNWSAADIELAKTVVELLDPLLSSVRAKRRIEGDFELGAITYATYCARIARDRDGLAQWSGWLVKHVPVPLIVAELCLRGLVAAIPEGLPNRLRVEHPGEFQASFLAAILDRELFGRAEAAFDALVELSKRAGTDEEKESVCIAIFETCGRCGPEQIQRAIEVVTALRPGDSRLLGLLHAIRQLEAGNVTEAAGQLQAVRDEADGVWWQAYAHVCEKAGNEEAAQQAWEKASELLPHPDVVRRSIKASFDRRTYESAVRGLRKLLENDPDNKQNLKALAWALTRLNDHAQAAVHLRRLAELDASNQEYRLWLAQSLARTARVADAIEVLRPLCASEEAPLEAILLQSELLGADSRPVEAFRLLEAVAPDHWDDPRFLLTYLHRGHAAGEDRLAHEAFVRLLELKRQGEVPSELMQEGTLEQFLEYGKEYRGHRESLQEAVIAGRMPWLFAEDTFGNPPAWAWVLHTQELKWCSEEPLTRAAFSVYATNGFVARQTESGRRLVEITAPDTGAEIVADVSALLTLHHLGRLEEAADYFGRIILPASYGDLHVRDARRFGQHQASRETELRKIRKHIEGDRRIQVAADESSDLLLLDEYLDDPDRHVYRLQDLIPVLHVTQKASPSAIAELGRVAHKPCAAGGQHPALTPGANILIDLMSLRTLANQPVFEAVLDSCTVHLRTVQYQALIAELQAHEKARGAKDAHDALWRTVAELASRGKIRWQPAPGAAPQDGEDDPDAVHSVHLDSVRVAQHLKLPLLVDDRVLQVLFFQSDPGGGAQAFGSDCLLLQMQGDRSRGLPAAAADYRRLMRWRYRFLVPPADLLFAWAEESIDALPGPALLDAAAYVHDCLRDPGLHCGPEQTDPQMPMAVRFVTVWVTSIATFLARVWNDDRFPEDRCAALTSWVGEELIPSCPRGLWLHQIGTNVTRAERSSVFSMAMVQFTGVGNQDRANLGLRTLAHALGLDEDQYLAAAADAIQASIGKEQSRGHPPDDEYLFSRRMMQNALLHYVDRGLEPLAFSRFRELGLFRDLPVPPVPASLAQLLHAAAHPADARSPGGPLVLVPEDQRAAVVSIDSVLLHPDADLRRAAVGYLQSAVSSPDTWLTPRLADLLRDHAADMQAEDETRWRPAANLVARRLREDLFAQFAGLRQSLAWRYQEGIRQHIGSLLHPGLETLMYLRPSLWSPTEQRDEIAAWIAEASRLPTLHDALTSYLGRCGYVPLCAELGAPQVTRLWQREHPDATVRWDQVWSWAIAMANPLARYHAVIIALHCPDVRPHGMMDDVWAEVCMILQMNEGNSDQPEPNRGWQLYCELASHYARHIEALHPGQHGDRVACYAWWLAARLGGLLPPGDRHARWFQDNVLAPEAQFSYFRWTFARSPVVPAPFRHATLHLSSVWAMSLLAHLSLTAPSFPAPGPPPAVRETIGKVLHGYLLTSPLAVRWAAGAPAFAFEDNSALECLCADEGLTPEDRWTMLAELLAFRRHLSSPDELGSCLGQFPDLPLPVQHLAVLAVKDAVYSSARYDDAISRWLEQTDVVVAILQKAPEEVTGPILEMLAEFQQHQVGGWPLRLPHLLAFAIEESDDPDRVRLLSPHVLQQSINAGIASPIHRLVNSQRWPDSRAAIATWRQNLVDVAKRSEAWLAARVRAASAAVSQLIGPLVRGPLEPDSPSSEPS